jgi:hypothetical protein
MQEIIHLLIKVRPPTRRTLQALMFHAWQHNQGQTFLPLARILFALWSGDVRSAAEFGVTLEATPLLSKILHLHVGGIVTYFSLVCSARISIAVHRGRDMLDWRRLELQVNSRLSRQVSAFKRFYSHTSRLPFRCLAK